MTKIFLTGALILGLMTSMGTGVLAQTDFSAPRSMEDLAKAPLINQGSPETSTGAVTAEERNEDFAVSNDIIKQVKEQCNRRDPKIIINETVNKICTAVGCNDPKFSCIQE